MMFNNFREFAIHKIAQMLIDYPNATAEQLIKSYPHKAQKDVFDIWKEEVANAISDNKNTPPTTLNRQSPSKWISAKQKTALIPMPLEENSVINAGAG